VRVNSVDAGMYGQWNQPATSGTAQIPVTAGPNTVEIEVRDGAGQNWLMGRLDIVMTSTVQFMRRTVVDCTTGETVSVIDTTLDGDPYTVTGLVGQCEPVAECCEQPPPETRLDVETHILCAVDPVAGTVLRQVLIEQVYDDQTGLRTEQRLTDPTTGDAVELPAGAILATCPDIAEPCDVRNVLQACRCDDADGDGLADTDYVELIGVDCDGALTPLGTYLPDLSAPYTPVAPISCEETDEGAENAIGVQARRVELTAGQSWDAAVWPTLQSVTAIAHGGTGAVLTDDGSSTLHSGEAATWSVARDTDALLTGPLTITADTGTVTLSYTIGVTL
jgi:hypothetical protein